MQPFEDSIYSGCYSSAYNNWAAKVPNAGFAKSFSAWPLAGMTSHHGQSFNTGSSNGAGSGYPYAATGSAGSASSGYAMYAAAAAAAAASNATCNGSSPPPSSSSCSIQAKDDDFHSITSLRLKSKNQLDYSGNYSTSSTSTTVRAARTTRTTPATRASRSTTTLTPMAKRHAPIVVYQFFVLGRQGLFLVRLSFLCCRIPIGLLVEFLIGSQGK